MPSLQVLRFLILGRIQIQDCPGCHHFAGSIFLSDFRQALGDSFIEIANTDEGKDIISVFSQVGYEWGDDSNYDGEREAQELLKSME